MNPRDCPRKAVVLAAGLGTRMHPLTACVPKPLLPLWGVPALRRVLDLLRGWGVREVLVNAHHHAGALIAFLARACPGLRLAVSYEPEILGTGGALRRAAWFLDSSPFWIVNADIAAELSPGPLVQEFRRRNPLSVVWLWEGGPRTVSVKGMRILTFRARDPARPSRLTLTGLHLAAPRVLDYLPASGFSSIIDAYEAAIAQGESISGVTIPRSFWADLGRPEDYLRAHAAVRAAHRRREPGAALFPPGERGVAVLRRRGVRIDGFACVAATASIAAGARLRNAVVLDGARIGSGARAEDAVVAPGTRLPGPAVGVAAPAEALTPADPARLALRGLRWPAARVTVVALPARGSGRSFTRLMMGTRRAMLVAYTAERPENARYAAHARYLDRQGVAVPRVLAEFPGERLVAMEDVGDRSLESVAATTPAARLEARYRLLLDNVLRLHHIPPRAAARCPGGLEPAFSADLYRWERELFATHFLERWAGLPPAGVRAVLAGLERVAARLLHAPAVLVHRDLQSSNVHLHRGQTVLLDFQGMRLGPAAYDVASLLCDPYVMLPEDSQRRLLAGYLRGAEPAWRVDELFWPAAVQRLSQALGAFGRLSARPETARFAARIPPALAMLRRALGFQNGLDALARLVDSLLA